MLLTAHGDDVPWKRHRHWKLVAESVAAGGATTSSWTSSSGWPLTVVDHIYSSSNSSSRCRRWPLPVVGHVFSSSSTVVTHLFSARPYLETDVSKKTISISCGETHSLVRHHVVNVDRAWLKASRIFVASSQWQFARTELSSWTKVNSAPRPRGVPFSKVSSAACSKLGCLIWVERSRTCGRGGPSALDDAHFEGLLFSDLRTTTR